MTLRSARSQDMVLFEEGCSLAGLASKLDVDCSSQYSCEMKNETLCSTHKGQSSEKSSQDRLSFFDFQDKEEAECWPEESPISSKLYIPTSVSAGSMKGILRVSPRRLRVELHRKETSVEESPRHGSCTDPEWSPSNGREEASSGTSPAGASGSPGRLEERGTSEFASNARQSVEDALKDAHLKKERASKMVAAAKRLAVDAIRSAKRRRLVQKPADRLHSPEHILLEARVAVYWPDDKQFYNGKVVDVKDEGFLHKIEYDDEVTEWLPLSSERFTLLTPRTTSAGCTTQLLEEIEALDAEELSVCKQAAAKSDLGSHTPTGEAALGWLIAIQCRSNGYACQGQLIAYEAETDMHHLLYTDGEDEWLCLAKECTQWIRHLDHPIAPGLPAGLSKPVGEQAVGWRVAVYWKADKVFYQASIRAFDPASGQYCLAYAKGDQEHLHLGKQCLKWCPAPEASKYSHPSSMGRGTLASLKGSEPNFSGKITADGVWGSTLKVSRPRSSRLGKRQISWNSSCTPPGLAPKKPVNESVDDMLERVDADEEALMSNYPTPYIQAQPKLKGYSSAPLQLEGADSRHYFFHPMTPAQTAELHRRAFPVGAQPTQALRVPSPAPLWSMEKPCFEGFECPAAPALRCHFVKSETDLRRHLGPHMEEKPLSGLLADLERATSVPTAPSPAPLLDYIPNHNLLFQEPGLATQDHCRPCPLPDLGSGNMSLDMSADDYLNIDDLMPQVDAHSHDQDWMTDL